ncbi:MAG: non-hydrolyzing UDP-N-acetylglucosamine 2-epimerase [Flavobacteriia bacterium]
MKKRIVTIVGARPQIIKSSAINRAIADHFSDHLEEIIVHTGQHYDENMSHVFFKELGIPEPHYNLHVGSGSHGLQTAKMIEGLEAVFLSEKPDAVLVYGDTNSTIAGALAAIKIHIPIIHVEAGLRSFNKAMPEEVNRIASDHMSTLLFTPSISGLENLKREGFRLHDSHKATANHPKVYHCGDVMFDNSVYFSKLSDERSVILSDLRLQKNKFILTTIHRDSNTDIAKNLENIFSALFEIKRMSGLSIVLPIHPRTKSKLKEQLTVELYDLITNDPEFKIVPPAGFLDIIALEKNACLIITDSGGLQKEAFFFEKPCVVLRPQTEWIEIVENGNAVLADASKEKILAGFELLMNKTDLSYPPLYGDGQAAKFICERIIEDL